MSRIRNIDEALGRREAAFDAGWDDARKDLITGKLCKLHPANCKSHRPFEKLQPFSSIVLVLVLEPP